MVHSTWVQEESTWGHYTWVCGTGLPAAGSENWRVPGVPEVVPEVVQKVEHTPDSYT